MTEDKAKTKWCPHVRHMVYPNTVDPSGGNMPHYSSCCIASDCMMWVATDNECEPQEPQYGTSAIEPDPICKPAGHCGLVK